MIESAILVTLAALATRSAVSVWARSDHGAFVDTTMNRCGIPVDEDATVGADVEATIVVSNSDGETHLTWDGQADLSQYPGVSFDRAVSSAGFGRGNRVVDVTFITRDALYKVMPSGRASMNYFFVAILTKTTSAASRRHAKNVVTVPKVRLWAFGVVFQLDS